jgi:hypothetical protein
MDTLLDKGAIHITGKMQLDSMGFHCDTQSNVQFKEDLLISGIFSAPQGTESMHKGDYGEAGTLWSSP